MKTTHELKIPTSMAKDFIAALREAHCRVEITSGLDVENYRHTRIMLSGTKRDLEVAVWFFDGWRACAAVR